jgi:hypothetical protein
MTFGAACSPCSATYVKNLNAEQWKEEFPEAFKDIIFNHYVDDYLGGAPSVEPAKQRIREVIKITRRRGFEIAQWTTNNREVLESIPADLRSSEWKSIESDKDLPTEKTGIIVDSRHRLFHLLNVIFIKCIGGGVGPKKSNKEGGAADRHVSFRPFGIHFAQHN